MSSSEPARRSRRRTVLTVAWVVIGALIAASLVKLAFFPNSDAAAAQEPTGGLETPLVTVARGDVTNTFTVNGTVTADAGVPIRATEQGTITDVYVKTGDKVERGALLFDVREQIGTTTPEQPQPDPDNPDAPLPPAPEPQPIYQYHSVTAPASGIVTSFTPLIKQAVTIGEELGQIGPGTFTVIADLTAAMQYRMLDQPSTATVTISGGPAPFTCADLQIGTPPTPQQPQ